MNIDEFLDSDKTRENIGKDTILKIKYNDNIDFLYKPFYGEFEYGNELHFLGFFEKITKKLYGCSYDFCSDYNKEMKSNYYECFIDKISERLKNGANMYLNKYVEENQTQLMGNSKKIFNKHIADNWIYNNIKDNVIKDYIYDNEDIKISFSINSNCYKENIKELILKYIQNPIETTKGIFEEYINNTEKIETVYFDGKYNNVSVKEHLGVILLKQQLKNNLLQELKDNPNNEYRKKHDIIQSIRDLDAQMVNITIKHDNQIIDFKYPKDTLNDLGFYSSKIPDLTVRNKVKELYKNVRNDDETFIREISKIGYNKKVFYEDKELLNLKESVSNDSLETHDIVDDMFD